MAKLLGISTALLMVVGMVVVAFNQLPPEHVAANEQPEQLSQLLTQWDNAIPTYVECVENLGFQTEVIPSGNSIERTRVRVFGDPTLRLENDTATTSAAADSLDGCMKRDLYWIDLQMALVKAGDTTTKIARPDN